MKNPRYVKVLKVLNANKSYLNACGVKIGDILEVCERLSSSNSVFCKSKDKRFYMILTKNECEFIEPKRGVYL